MKSIRLLSLLGWGLLVLFGVCGCSEDDGNAWPDVDGSDPQLTLNEEHHQTEAGREIAIAGAVSDKDGIAKIHIYCPDLYLDKTIDLIAIYEKPLQTYELDYKVKLSNNEVGDRFTIAVTVTDVGGRTVTKEMLVTLDGDYADPVFTTAPDASVTVLIKAETKFTLRFTVTDNRSIDYITIDIPAIDYTRRVEAAGVKTYEFAEKITLPSQAAAYTMNITAMDRSGKSAMATTRISVSELPDFTKMYLADVATAAELNSDIMGVPMLIERTAAYTYKARYYCSAANTEIFFLPQKTDFSPICFGIDPDDETRLTDNPETAKPIVLPTPNLYYQITFNTKTGVYDVSSYSIAEAIDPLPQAIGSDYYLDPSQPQHIVPFQIGIMYDGPGNVIVLTQDAANPHRFYTAQGISLEAGKNFKGEAGTLNFTVHNKHDWGWWDYCTWRADSSSEPEILYYYSKSTCNPAYKGHITTQDNWAKPTVRTTGTYKFYFDAHLGSGKFVPAN